MTSTLSAHLKTGLTTVCRCWSLVRKDGSTLGFTDHDQDLSFGGIEFKAGSGMTPSAITTATGLSVDNSEAIGALDSDVIREADIADGLYDGAEIVSYLVNWNDAEQHEVLFRGHLGELTRSGSQFRAEIRGLSDFLNQPRGRVFQKPCSAILGDAQCGFDLGEAGYGAAGHVVTVESDSRIIVDVGEGHADRWFERGLVEFGSNGREFSIKRDDIAGNWRQITFWKGLNSVPKEGDAVKLVAGCDRRFETCRNKFNNIRNFRGFPDVPGGDWVLRVPSDGQIHDGGSLR